MSKNDAWRRIRYSAFIQFLNNGFIKGSDKPKRPEELFRIEGDIDYIPKTEQELKEDYDRITKAWSKLLK